MLTCLWQSHVGEELAGKRSGGVGVLVAPEFLPVAREVISAYMRGLDQLVFWASGEGSLVLLSKDVVLWTGVVSNYKGGIKR